MFAFVPFENTSLINKECYYCWWRAVKIKLKSMLIIYSLEARQVWNYQGSSDIMSLKGWTVLACPILCTEHEFSYDFDYSANFDWYLIQWSTLWDWSRTDESISMHVYVIIWITCIDLLNIGQRRSQNHAPLFWLR